MRVVSLVPSLTETLIECGVDVVGRTRFCVHPADKVAEITRVGGTKGVNWQRLKELDPDWVIFDKEENLQEMAAQCPFPWAATHVKSIRDCAIEFNKLGDILQSESLAELAQEWAQLSATPTPAGGSISGLPGLLEPLHSHAQAYSRIEYIIWRDPWMAVSANTFIGSVLTHLGFGPKLANHAQPYPVLSEADMQREDTFYLFSSEPYRFLRYHQQLLNEGFHGAIVDGELYSWFGIRSLRALQKLKQ